jgi:hypothetical protein
MIEVRIRHEDEGSSVFLTNIPFDQLDSIIPTLESWGLADAYGCTLSGQFVYDVSSAYFEIVLHEPEYTEELAARRRARQAIETRAQHA